MKVDSAQFALVVDPSRIERNILLTEASPAARDAIQTALDQQQQLGAMAAGLTLGSPDFQRVSRIQVIYMQFHVDFFFAIRRWRWPASAPRRCGWSARRSPANNRAPRKKVLVAIFQRGAADGLNIVVPHGERRYYDLRPPSPCRGPRSNIAAEDAAIDLDGFFGLHPSLALA